MRQLVPILFAILLLQACTPAEVVPPPTGEAPVTMWLLSTPSSGGVEVRFHLHDKNYTHIVQEIELDNGAVLIECFRDDGYIRDHHHWPTRPHRRTMLVYAANVEGADEAFGFAHLPDNGAGRTTTVGKEFNAWYQADYETRGRIASRSPFTVQWTIVDDGRTVTVTLPN